MPASPETPPIVPELSAPAFFSGDSGYEEARRIWNSLFDAHPAVIVRPRCEKEVAAAVQYARARNLEIAIKGGGHHAAGYASTEGGMLFDMSGLRTISVDPGSRVVHAGAGLTWAHFDQVTQAFGLASTGPIVSMTGIAGFTLGGGMGWLHRKIGLGCDNLKAATIVTADSEVLTASETENSDLFWGLKGSGWNFGVLTEMEFDAQPVGPIVTAGLIYYPIEQFASLVEHHNLLKPEFPDELTTWFFLRLAPPAPVIPQAWVGKPVVALAFCHCGAPDEGKHWAAKFANVADPIVSTVAPVEYRAWQRSLDGRWGDGFYNDWRGHYLDSISPEAIRILVEYVSNLRSPWTDIKIAHLGGAIRRVPESATAFGSRNAEFALVIQARWENAGESDFWVGWARELRDAIAPHATGGVYANFLAREESGRVPSAHGVVNHARLRELKRKYDPKNIFRLNPNIVPA
jgi:FAD/FMN-containing dehydrogenase